MQNVTLDTIKEEHNKVAALIATYESQLTLQYVFPETEIKLAHGEHYAGLLIGKNGEASHHLVLLPSEGDSLTWEDAKKWAAKAKGELPTRREQALLYANLKEQFQESWYWSSEQHASSSNSAWFQSFDNGDQDSGNKDNALRARAVRRIVI
jgi:hypothetical protein